MRYVTLGDKRRDEKEDLRFFRVNSGSRGFREIVKKSSEGARFLHRGVTHDHVFIQKLLMGNGGKIV